MAPSHVLKPQPDVSNSTSILAATIKHIAEDNPTELVEATGRFLTQTFKGYITTPLSRIATSAFVITAALITVSIILLERLVHSASQLSYRQFRKEELQRQIEKRLEREVAEWQKKKDEIIRDRPNDVESLEYISGHTEEF